MTNHSKKCEQNASRGALRSILTVALAIATTGCTNLSAVGDISNSLSMASSSWNNVAGDIAESCQRRLAISSSSGSCDDQLAASQGLATANNVLRAYFQALGAAANEANFSVGDGLNEVVDSVNAIPGINTDQVEAVSGIFGFLANLGTERLRERELRRLIDDGAGPAQDVIAMMDELLVDRFRLLLDDEERVLNAAMVTWINANQPSIGTSFERYCTSPIAVFVNGGGDASSYALLQEYCGRFEVLTERRAAISAYEKSLVTASQALQELRSNRTELSGRELAGKLYAIGSELDDHIGSVREAFG